MLKRPNHLVYSDIKLNFNGRVFNEIEIDLNHINKGKRSVFTSASISNLLLKSVDGKVFSSSGHKKFGSESCTYFKIPLMYKKKIWRLVLCICSDKPNTLGVITFFRES